jgi:hypothetical protein
MVQSWLELNQFSDDEDWWATDVVWGIPYAEMLRIFGCGVTVAEMCYQHPVATWLNPI